MKFKSLLATGLSCVLALSSGTAVLAAESYSDVMRKSIEEITGPALEAYDETLDHYEDKMTGGSVQISAELGPTGKSLMGIFSPVAVSWLNDASMDIRTGIDENTLGSVWQVSLNGTTVVSVESLIDIPSREMCFRIPELSADWIYMKADAEYFAQATGSDPSEFGSFDELFSILENPSSIKEKYPSGELISSLITRYSELLFAGVTEEDGGETAIAVNGISQDCREYTASVNEKQAQELFRTVLKTARDDADLKELIAFAEKMAPQESTDQDLYSSFQSSIDEVLGELESDEEIEEESDAEEDNTRLVHRLWVSPEDRIVGSQLALLSYDEELPIFTLYAPENENQKGLLVQINNGPDPLLTISGNSSVDANGILTGSYEIGYQGTSLAEFTINSYDTISAENKIQNASFRLAPAAPSTDETAEEINQILSMISSFALNIDITSSEDISAIAFGLDASGESLGTVTISSLKEALEEFPVVEEGAVIYDLSDEEAMQTFADSIRPDQILENLRTAGMPQEVIDMITGSAEEEPYPLDGEGSIVTEDTAEPQTEGAAA